MSKEEKVAFVAHGFADDYITPWWGPVHHNLEEIGYEVERVHFDGLLKTVDSPAKYAEDLGETIDRKLSDIDYDPEEILVVGHSMGGIVVRYAVEVLGYADETDIIMTFGSPHQGTRVADPFTEIFEGAKDMSLGSDFLNYLNEDGVAEDVEYLSFYTPDDTAFFDYKNAKIPADAENVENIQIGRSNQEIVAENIGKSVELGFNMMFDFCNRFQKVLSDAAFAPWRLANPLYPAELAEETRIEKRFEELQDIVENDPQEFFTGHLTMFYNDETWDKVSEKLEPQKAC